MDRKLNLKKGDKCIMAVVPMSNFSRGMDLSLKNIDNWTYEGEVVSVTKKYITILSGGNNIKFEVDNNYYEKVNRGGSNFKLYENLEDIRMETEKKELFSKIESAFSSSCLYNKTEKFTLDQLRRINDIINEE